MCVFSAISVIDLDSNRDHIDILFTVLLLVQLTAFPTILFYPAGKKTEDPVRRLSQSLKITHSKPKIKSSKNLKSVMDSNFYMVLFDSFLSPSEIYVLSHIHPFHIYTSEKEKFRGLTEIRETSFTSHSSFPSSFLIILSSFSFSFLLVEFLGPSLVLVYIVLKHTFVRSKIMTVLHELVD